MTLHAALEPPTIANAVTVRMKALVYHGPGKRAWEEGASPLSAARHRRRRASGTSTTLTVMLKDSPFSDGKALLVTFSAVEAHASGGAFIPIPFSGGATTRTCDLKKLTTAQDVLGAGPLPAGHYTQIRLVVSSAAIYFDNPSAGSACATTIASPAGHTAPVEIPSGELKLNREFDLVSTAATTILLDFDGDQSVKETGNGRYMMTPVIAIVSVQ